MDMDEIAAPPPAETGGLRGITRRRLFFGIAGLTATGILTLGGGHIAVKKGILSPASLRLLQAKVLEKKPLGPGEFLKTEDFPTVQEALLAVERARRVGGLVMDMENPIGKALERARKSGESTPEGIQGDRVDRLFLFVYGDIHQPGSEPKKEATYRSPVYRRLLKSGKDQRKRAGDESWPLDVRPRRLTEGWLSIRLTILANLGLISEFMERGKSETGKAAVSIVDAGDRCGTGSDIADVAFSAIEAATFRREVQDAVREATRNKEHPELQINTVQQIKVKGNHDVDLRNHPHGGKGQEKLYGNQISLQEVGGTHLVLTIDTNLYDPFWLEYAAKLKGNPRFKDYLERMNLLKDQQTALIKKAVATGRKIILIGHDEKLILKIIDLKRTRVTHVVSGHFHRASHKMLIVRNNDGDKIERVRVGSTYRGRPGAEKIRAPVGYAIEINPGALEEVVIHDLKIPEFAELENIQYLM